MDADGDEELSFSDFFSSLLPYFIYGDLRDELTPNLIANKISKQNLKKDRKAIPSFNTVAGPRAKSASATNRRKPLPGKPNFFQQNAAIFKNHEDYMKEALACDEVNNFRTSQNLQGMLKDLV